MGTAVLDILDYVFYAVVIPVAVVGNGFVIFSITKFEFLRSNASFFVGSLACSDLLMALASGAVLGMKVWQKEFLVNAHSSWDICCKISINLQIYAIHGDFLSIFAITVDRFIYINFPLKYEMWVTSNRVCLAIFLMFTIAAPLSAVFAWYPDRLSYDKPCTLFVALDPQLLNIMWLPLSIFGSTVIITLYIKVAHILYKAKQQVQSLHVNSNGYQETQGKNLGKSTMALMLVLGVFLCTYTIWLIVYYFTLNEYSGSAEVLQKVTDWMWQTNIWINPLIYAYKNKDFKRAFSNGDYELGTNVPRV